MMDAQTMAAMNNLAAALERIDPLFGRLAQDQRRVEGLLSRISQALGVPVDDFRDDAFAWCAGHVPTVETMLRWALSEVEAKRKPPWERQ